MTWENIAFFFTVASLITLFWVTWLESRFDKLHESIDRTQIQLDHANELSRRVEIEIEKLKHSIEQTAKRLNSNQ